MNYIYDIYLNFNNNYYDFFEWYDTDKILHINKIPIIKIDTKTFLEIISNNIKLNTNIFNNKTEINNKKYTCFLITDNRNILAIMFNKDNISTKISSLILDDEYNILNSVKKIKQSNIEYKIINKRNYIYSTREEYIQKKYILDNINKLPIDTLKYIYYDCFNTEETNYNKIIDKIINNINNNSKICNKIYDILNPISMNF